jgi:uncharacterized protein
MQNVHFSWDAKKNHTNKLKHGISFEEAQTVFYDEKARLFPDDEHSDDEERYILLGFSQVLHLLVVCHCYRQSDKVIRIFSARKATKKESKSYEGAGEL